MKVVIYITFYSVLGHPLIVIFYISFTYMTMTTFAHKEQKVNFHLLCFITTLQTLQFNAKNTIKHYF